MSPASWEIKSQRDKRILLAVITPPDLGVSMDFAQNMRNLHLPPGSEWMRVVGFPFGPARNQAAKTALDNGYQLAFLDSDVRVQQDAYIILAETGLDLVSGLYFQRFHPYIPCAFNAVRDDKGNVQKAPITGWKPGDIVPCQFVPSGLTIYRRRMLEKVFERHPLPFMWGVDVAPVPDYGGQAIPFSEDFAFSWKAYELGFQPMVHTGVVGLHEVRAVVGPRWIIPMPSPEPIMGVCGVV